MTKTDAIESVKKSNYIMGQVEYAKELTLWLLDCVDKNEIENSEGFIFNLNNKIAIDLSDLKTQIEIIDKETR